MAVAIEEPSGLAVDWIAQRPVLMDFGGPEDIGYVPLSEAAENFHGIEPFERAVERYADKVAIYDGTTSLSYAEVLDRVYGLARQIDEMLPKGAVVTSLVGSTAAAPIIVLACFAVGRTLVPLDAGHPLERKRALFEESGAQLLLLDANAKVDDSFIPADLPRIKVDATMETGAERINCPADPADPMFVIFTSGSTGRPKGLAFANRHASTMSQTIDTFHLNENDIVLGLGSLTSGGSRDTFMALISGATIRLIDVKRAGLMEALRVIEQEQITFMSFVPSYIRMLFGLPGIEKSLRSLRILDLHGEATLPEDMALMRSSLPEHCHISITLGATETGLVFTWYAKEDKIEDGRVPVGYLIPGKQVAIIGEDGNSVRPGEIGELVVRGMLARGGWQKGELTQGRFLPDPDRPDWFVYPMGDLVRLRPDGLFEHHGRKDRQLKIRGQWADLGAVEAALRSCGGVADAVVDAIGAGGSEQIVAYVVPEKSVDAPTAAELRRAVATATAEHMVPGRIEMLDAIPRLANFKPDLKRLEAMLA
ncbi:acyl-coenzyme A synthetase/AMP-(fatty) acid ligase [Altererythrobacter atlanticus]|uniref:Tyrocidine synthase 3 n=1 Tax=Croceibacterium atlanticum TaxID=1267766 RepID=A0A0F7KQ28_9SPHN|nr:AMP-binding protein [Croceibacterium atlanticum]AKH41236.1 Tyrocidine synthase 3 [Croceibacterium atlanticum]MBB5732754.1 acyl-coenzyme A synthetase/AMP-(fatty) acid ligase [Croceibacterium atlanticum]